MILCLLVKMMEIISTSDINNFRILVEQEMLKMGASNSDFRFIHDEAIINTIRRNGSPEELAWALLQ